MGVYYCTWLIMAFWPFYPCFLCLIIHVHIRATLRIVIVIWVPFTMWVTLLLVAVKTSEYLFVIWFPVWGITVWVFTLTCCCIQIFSITVPLSYWLLVWLELLLYLCLTFTPLICTVLFQPQNVNPSVCTTASEWHSLCALGSSLSLQADSLFIPLLSL